LQKKILRLNFGSFDKKWMLNYAYAHLRDNWSPAPWKKELIYFLIDWYSDKDTVEALTSGSTGAPKTIKLNKKFMENSAAATIDFFKLNKNDKVLLALPVKYIAAKMMIVRGITGKLDVYCIEPSLYPFSELTPPLDFAAFTPAQFSKLLETTEGKTFVKNIKKVLLGGAPIPRALENKIKSLETDVWHSYGMTETMSHIALRKVNGNNASDKFYPLQNVEISVSEQNTLVITAPHLGLYNMQTNDIVTIFPGHGFTVHGRKDNVINSGGVKLHPEEIERKIEPFLSKPFYVAPAPDTKFGEIPVLFIEDEEWSKTKTERLLQQIEKTLSRLEMPKSVFFKSKFRRTGNGKIIREKTD